MRIDKDAPEVFDSHWSSLGLRFRDAALEEA
jgi:hypothetical protein